MPIASHAITASHLRFSRPWVTLPHRRNLLWRQVTVGGGFIVDQVVSRTSEAALGRALRDRLEGTEFDTSPDKGSHSIP